MKVRHSSYVDVWKNDKVDEGVETALAVTDDLFLIEGMEVTLE